MKDSEHLKTGQKPAPGELALLQGFINTVDLESGTDDLVNPVTLKAWLVRHGLLARSGAVTEEDYTEILSFRESVRQLLVALHGGPTGPEPVLRLNRLVNRCNLSVRFNSDGRVLLQPTGKGTEAVIGRFLAIIAQASLDGTWLRLKVCEASTCQWAFYDASKNHSGRWCSMSICGSRTKARQFRKRHARGHG